MCPLPNEVLEIRPRILGIRTLVGFWSLLAPTIADSRRARVAAAKVIMAIDPKWYRDGLEFVRRNRRWEEQRGVPSSSTRAQVGPSSTQPPEDPLTTPLAQCFAKVPHHPNFGVPRTISHNMYMLDMVQHIFVFITYVVLYLSISGNCRRP